MENDFNCLVVTAIEVYLRDERTSHNFLKGYVTIVLNNQFIVRGLRIFEGENGLFVRYPQSAFPKGADYLVVCNPLTRQLREHIEDVVIRKYREVVNDV